MLKLFSYDHKKKRGRGGKHCEAVAGITIQSKFKKIKGQDRLGNCPNPGKINLEGKPRYPWKRSQSLSLSLSSACEETSGWGAMKHQRDPRCCGQDRRNEAVGWASAGYTQNPPTGLGPPPPTPAARGAPSRPRGQCAPSSCAQADSLLSAQREMVKTLFLRIPSKQQTETDPRAWAFCCGPGSSPGITY